MKIKCPACSTMLQAPDSAAGKVIQCQCGKQLRLPAAPATARAVPQPMAAGQPRPAVPAPTRPPGPTANPFGLDNSAFDDLTTDDMKPIRGVAAVAPATAKTSHAGAAALKQYASPGDVGSNATPGQRPGTLTFLGVINAIWTVLYFFGVLLLFGISVIAANEIEAEDLAEAPEAVAWWGLIVFSAVFLMLSSLAISVSCFVSKTICWYIVIAGYAFFFADRIMGLVGEFRGEEVDIKSVVQAIIGLIVGGLFWAYLHGDESRAFYRIPKSKLKLAIAPNAVGFLVGIGLRAAVVFMV